MSTPENEMDKLHGQMLPKVKHGSDKMHHMTAKKINRQVTPDTAYPDNPLLQKPNTEIPMNPPKDSK